MTLDVKALLKNLLKKQMSIQHFTAKTDVFAVGAIPKRIKDKIKEEFGDQFLLDANYVVFFRGDINKDGRKKLQLKKMSIMRLQQLMMKLMRL